MYGKKYLGTLKPKGHGQPPPRGMYRYRPTRKISTDFQKREKKLKVVKSVSIRWTGSTLKSNEKALKSEEN